jgi:YidC/Oxa1 family membrane protein insertase
MIHFLWQNFLYDPLINILIFIYNNFTDGSLGMAVVILTILLRLVMLPLTIISEKSKGKYKDLDQKVKLILDDRYTDPVKKREIIRDMLRKNQVSPWAKSITLAIQAVVLIVLYQVFMGGINMHKFANLYSWVYVPDYVNTVFLGFDLGVRNIYWSAVVAVILFFEIKYEQDNRKAMLQNSEVVYKYAFPLFTFLVLYYLPMVKSLFILTSIIFSFTIMAVVAFMRQKTAETS